MQVPSLQVQTADLEEKNEPPVGRSIILCFDGTSNKFGHTNSNVLRLFRSLKKDSEKQLVYYHPGLGTYTQHPLITNILFPFVSAIDQCVAFSLHDHVKDGYEFLMRHHRPGDKVFLFGFSRGAYTARALAGMLYKVGLLPPDNVQQVDFAFLRYIEEERGVGQICREFQDTFSKAVTVEFLGAWDTVSSVGIIPRYLPHCSPNFCVKMFRHVLALDERRARFRPSTWNEPRDGGLEVEPLPSSIRPLGGDEEYQPPDRPYTDVKEVWFAGCHADVGGGSHVNTEKTSLSSITLRWMIKECFLARTEIDFDFDYLNDLGLDVEDLRRHDDVYIGRNMAKLAPPRSPSSPSSHSPIPLADISEAFGFHDLDLEEGKFLGGEDDSHAPIFDQLGDWSPWWLLEFVPVLDIYQGVDGSWIRRRVRNFGRGRYMPYYNHHIKVHTSVRDRMEDEQLNYRPAAWNWDMAMKAGMIVWVN